MYAQQRGLQFFIFQRQATGFLLLFIISSKIPYILFLHIIYLFSFFLFYFFISSLFLPRASRRRGAVVFFYPVWFGLIQVLSMHDA